MKDTMSIARYFSTNIRPAVEKIIDRYGESINEIRLRTGKPLAVVSYGKSGFAAADGTIEKSVSAKTVYVSAKDISYSFNAICDYSIHSYESEIAQGYITVCGGHRAGFCGTAVRTSDKVSAVKYINSVNFRIASQVRGCADKIMDKLFVSKPVSLIIAGEPACGKTTLLRDLSRQLSEKFTVSVIDERSEICAVFHGEPQNETGSMCDIFDGYPKAYGFQTALRVMSPDIVICDEIGDAEETDKLLSCVNSGVKIIASAHAGNFEELLCRKNIRKLIDNSVFDYAVILDGKANPGKIKRIVRLNRDVFENAGDNYDNYGMYSHRNFKIVRNEQTDKTY